MRSSILGFTASPGLGGPAGTKTATASPAVPESETGEAVNALKARGEQILAEMRAVLDRSDDALWMIRREFDHRKDLIDGAFEAHIDMGCVQRDVRDLIKGL